MNKIRNFRTQMNWTLKRLAEVSGVSYKALWRMERGDDPKLKYAYKIASVFQLTVYELWGIPSTGEHKDTYEAKTISLRELRQERGWSFSHLRNLSNVSINTLFRIENGQEPTLGRAIKIAAALGVSVYQLWKPET